MCMPLGDGFYTKPLDAALDEIDADITAACVHRRTMFRKYLARQDDANRQAFDDATEHLNDLLEMRYAMVQAEQVPT